MLDVNYIFEGSGDKTIVFIHGLSDSLEYWRRLSIMLRDDYNVLSYDLRGHGESEYGDEKFTMDLLAQDLYDLFLKLNIEKASLIALSLGGNIALTFALKYPELVDKLVLMSTFSENDDNFTSKCKEFKKAINISYEAFFDTIIRYVIPQEIYDENREVLEVVKNMKAETANIKAIENGIDIGMEFNVTDQLSKIENETLILKGRDDDIISLNLAQILNDNINDSKLIIFDDTKHDLLIESNISEILKLLRQFV